MKTIKSALFTFIASAVVAAGSAFAGTEYTWNKGTTAASYTAAANWLVGGEAATAYPNDADDIAYFPALATINNDPFSFDGGTAEHPVIWTAAQDGGAKISKKFSLGTAALCIDSGSYTLSQDTTIASAANADATLVIDGGNVSFGSLWLAICRNAQDSTGSLMLKSGSLIGTGESPIVMGYGSDGSTSSLSIEDGEMVLRAGSSKGSAQSAGLILGFSKNSGSTVDISGGELKNYGYTTFGPTKDPSLGAGTYNTFVVHGDGKSLCYNDVRIGVAGTCVLTIKDNGHFYCGPETKSSSQYRSFYVGYSTSDEGSTVNLDGGVLEVCTIKYGSSTKAANMNLNGGTLKFCTSNQANAADDNANLLFNVLPGGAVIETERDKNMVRPLIAGAVGEGETAGGLTKKGAGTLTLAAVNTYQGETRVESGTLSLPANAFGTEDETQLNPAGGLELAGGSVSGTDYTWPTVTVSAGSYAYAALPSSASSAYETTGGEIVIVAESASTELSAPVLLNGGAVVVDITDVEMGDSNSVTVRGIKLGDEVNLSSVNFILKKAGAKVLSSLSSVADADGVLTVTATVAVSAFAWNGGSAAWADGPWVNAETDEAVAYEDGVSCLFDGRDIADGDRVTNVVSVASTVAPAKIVSTASEGRGYRFIGAAVDAVEISQVGAGALVFANESVSADSAAVTGGEIALDGTTLSAEELSIASSAMIRACGATVSTLDAVPSGAGTVFIDEGATIVLPQAQTLGVNVGGAGTLKPTGATFTVASLNHLAGYNGTLRVEAGTSLRLDAPLHNNEDYILGRNTTLVMAGGTVERFASKAGASGGTSVEWVRGNMVLEDGTTSVLQNKESRTSGGCWLRLYCNISGGGTANFSATTGNGGWRTEFNGDNSGFTGVMNLSGTHFAWTTASAGSEAATWNLTSANQFDLSHAASTCIKFGALNVSNGGASVYVKNNGAEVEIGNKDDSTINGKFTNEPVALTKVGAGTTLTLGAGCTMVEGSTVVVEEGTLIVNGDLTGVSVTVKRGATIGGTGTVGSLTFEAGAFVAIDGLSNDKTQTYTSVKSLAEPTWAKRPEVIQESGLRWRVNKTSEAVTPEEGDPYTLWTLGASWQGIGLMLILR